MTNREKVIEGLEETEIMLSQAIDHSGKMSVIGAFKCLNRVSDALKLLKAQKIRELTIDEWEEWKANPKRNPICELWENDTLPMWILDPNKVHEPALLMGKLKLFTGKPTFEQCKAVKWDD